MLFWGSQHRKSHNCLAWHSAQKSRVMVVYHCSLPVTVLGTVSLSSVVNMNISKGFLQGHLNKMQMEEEALIKTSLWSFLKMESLSSKGCFHDLIGGTCQSFFFPFSICYFSFLHDHTRESVGVISNMDWLIIS